MAHAGGLHEVHHDEAQHQHQRLALEGCHTHVVRVEGSGQAHHAVLRLLHVVLALFLLRRRHAQADALGGQRQLVQGLTQRNQRGRTQLHVADS